MRELLFFSGDPFVSVVFMTGEQVNIFFASITFNLY